MALGGAAAVPNTRTPGQFDPPTCQHALRQARRLAKNLQGNPEPYGYRMLGLLQLPLLSRKLRVVTDWTTSLFFRRDIAELSMLGHPRRLDP